MRRVCAQSIQLKFTSIHTWRHIKQTRCFLLFRIPSEHNHKAMIRVISQFERSSAMNIQKWEVTDRQRRTVLFFCQCNHYISLPIFLSTSKREEWGKRFSTTAILEMFKLETVSIDDTESVCTPCISLSFPVQVRFRKSLINDGSGRRYYDVSQRGRVLIEWRYRVLRCILFGN